MLTIDNLKELNEFCKNEKLLDFYKKKLIKLSSENKYKEDNVTELMERNIMLEETYTKGKIEGKKEGKKEGIQEGKIETQRNTVISMFKDNVPFKLISRYTNLSINKIKSIIKSSNITLDKKISE